MTLWWPLKRRINLQKRSLIHDAMPGQHSWESYYPRSPNSVIFSWVDRFPPVETAENRSATFFYAFRHTLRVYMVLYYRNTLVRCGCVMKGFPFDSAWVKKPSACIYVVTFQSLGIERHKELHWASRKGGRQITVQSHNHLQQVCGENKGLTALRSHYL